MTSTSIWSFPGRGAWGKSSYRGNASGHVTIGLIEMLQPKSLVDVTCGSGTTLDVVRDLYPDIKAFGLDLRYGFDSTSMSIVEKIGEEVDMSFSHPPYHSMVKYSGDQWGDAADDRDLSQQATPDEFHGLLQALLLNQREATRSGGHYTMLVGDYRTRDQYISTQAEMIARMPSAELKAVIIKAQHNCVSDSRNYKRLEYGRILHEYLLVWKKPQRVMSSLTTLAQIAKENAARVRGTWRAIVRMVMAQIGRPAALAEIYDRIEKHGPQEKLESNQWHRAKVRQVLQTYEEFFSEERGVWGLRTEQAETA